MDRPRICFTTVQYPPDIGGVGKSAQRIVSGLVASGFEVCVFACSPTAHEQPYKFGTVTGEMLYRVSPAAASLRRAIEAVDARGPFDLFHGFFLSGAYPCLKVARGQRPVIASIRGIDGFDPTKPKSRQALRRATWITSVSTDSLARAQTYTDISARSSFIPNSIDARQSCEWQPTAENSGIVGTVATFRPKKNIPLLVEAYSRIDARARRRLLLVGDFIVRGQIDESEQAAVTGLISTLGLAPEVTITGYVENKLIPQHLASMRVFVLSSDHEGLPNAVLEAAAAGLPIVATAVDGVRDIFVSGRDALLVPPGNAALLADAVQSVLQDEHLARSLGRAALQVANRHTPDTELEEYIRLYRHLLKSGAGSLRARSGGGACPREMAAEIEDDLTS